MNRKTLELWLFSFIMNSAACLIAGLNLQLFIATGSFIGLFGFLTSVVSTFVVSFLFYRSIKNL